MKYILLIMLLVTPPNDIKDADKGKKGKDTRVWALQTTTAFEMSTKEWCEYVATSIDGSANSTATITTRMFCIPKDEKDFIAELTPKAAQEKEKTPLGAYQKELGISPERLQCLIDNAIRVGPGKPKECK
jgi:hypothetical protein